MGTPSQSGYNSLLIKSEVLKGTHISHVHQAQNVTIKARYLLVFKLSLFFKTVPQELCHICKVFIFVIPLGGDKSNLWGVKTVTQRDEVTQSSLWQRTQNDIELFMTKLRKLFRALLSSWILLSDLHTTHRLWSVFGDYRRIPVSLILALTSTFRTSL